jgi:hypothetical protein
MNEQLLKKLYDKYGLSSVGTFDRFALDMQRPEVQKKIYDKYGLSKVGSFEKFQRDLGYIQPTAEPQQVAEQSTEEGRGVGGWAKDIGLSVGQGVLDAKKSVQGLLNMATLGLASPIQDYAEEKLFGGTTEDLSRHLESLKTEQTQQVARNIEEAEGFTGTLGAYVENPSAVVMDISRSAPSMVGGAGIARGGAALAGKMLPKLAKPLASQTGKIITGAAGEGLITTGGTAEDFRLGNEDKELTAKQAGLSLLTGTLTSAFGLFGGKVARKLGIDDIDTALAGGVGEVTSRQKLSAIQRTTEVVTSAIKGAISEGLFEELPQSFQEELIKALGQGATMDEAIDKASKAAASGLMSGIAMGSGFSSAKTATNNVVNYLKTKQVDDIIDQTTSTGKPEIDSPIDEVAKDVAQTIESEGQEANQVLTDTEEITRVYNSLQEVPTQLTDYAEVIEGTDKVVITAPKKLFETIQTNAVQEQGAAEIPQQPEAAGSQEIQQGDTEVGLQEPTKQEEQVVPDQPGEVTMTAPDMGFTFTSTESPQFVQAVQSRAFDGLREMGYSEEQIAEMASSPDQDQGQPQTGKIMRNGIIIDLETGNIITPKNAVKEETEFTTSPGEQPATKTITLNDGRTFTAEAALTADGTLGWKTDLVSTPVKVLSNAVEKHVELMPKPEKTKISIKAENQDKPSNLTITSRQLTDTKKEGDNKFDTFQVTVEGEKDPYRMITKNGEPTSIYDSENNRLDVVPKQVAPKPVRKRDTKKPVTKPVSKPTAKVESVSKPQTKEVVKPKTAPEKAPKEQVKARAKRRAVESKKVEPKKAEPKEVKKVEAKKAEPKKVEPVKEQPKDEVKTTVELYPKMPGMKKFTSNNSKSTVYFRESQADPNLVVLENIETPQEVRDANEKGNADRLLDLFLEDMDSKGRKVQLVVSPRDKNTDPERLWNWYAKKGFRAQIINNVESDFEMVRKAKKINKGGLIDSVKKLEDKLDKKRKRKGDRLQSSLMFGMEPEIAYYAVKAARIALQAGKTVAEAIQAGIDAAKTRLNKALTQEQEQKFADFIKEKASKALDPESVRIANQLAESGTLLGQQFEDIATRREAMAVEVSNLIRDEIYKKADTTKMMVDQLIQDVESFVEAWNQLALGRALNKADVSAIVQKMAGEKKSKPFNGEVQTVKVNDLIKRLTKNLEKGIKLGFRRGQGYVNAEIDKIRQVLKETKLTPRQTAAILNKLKHTNFYSPGAISDLNEYIDKVVESAEFAEQIGKAKKLSKFLKKLGRSQDSSIASDIRSAAKGLTDLGFDWFDNVDRLEKFLEYAEGIYRATQPTSSNNYAPVNLQPIMDEINNLRKEQEKEYLRRAAGDLNDSEIEQMLDEEGTSNEALADAITIAKAEVAREKAITIAEYARMGLDFVKDSLTGTNKQVAELLLSADLNNMPISIITKYTRLVDNLTVNGSIAGHGIVTSFIIADQVIDKLTPIASKFRGNVSEAANSLRSVGQTIDAIFRDNKFVAEFLKESGLDGVLTGSSEVAGMYDNITEELSKFLDKIDKKYSKRLGILRKRKQSIRNTSEQVKLAMLAEFQKYTGTDASAHINFVKENVRESIRRLKAMGDSDHTKLAKEMQDALDKYQDVTSADDAIKKFKQRDPHVFETAQWLMENVFNDAYTSAIESNTMNIHNKTFTRSKNYLPTIQMILKEVGSLEDTQFTTGVKPKLTKNALDATRNLGVGMSYSPNYLTGALNSWKKSMIDIKTSKHAQIVYALLSNPKADNLFGGGKNTNAVTNMTKGVMESIRGGKALTPAERVLNAFSSSFRSIGSALALGAVEQLPIQYLSALAGSAPLLGKHTAYVFSKTPKSFEEGVIGKRRISQRGKTHAGTYINDDIFSNADTNTLEQVAGKIRTTTGAAMYFLTKGDTLIAKGTWKAFYIKYLNEAGVKNVDLNKEAELQGNDLRQKAAAYADNMVTKLQVASNSAELSKFSGAKGVAGIARNLIFPFSSFPMNVKVRFVDAIDKIRMGNKKEGTQEMSSVFAETAAYAVLKVLSAKLWISVVEQIMREVYRVEKPEPDDPEEEADKKEIKAKRKLFSMITKDLIPFSIGFGEEFATWGVNTISDSIFYDEDKYESFEEYVQKNPFRIEEFARNEHANLGVYGIFFNQLSEAKKAVGIASEVGSGNLEPEYNTPFGKKTAGDLSGLEDMITINAVLEVLQNFVPIPREIRQANRAVVREQLKNPTPKRERTWRDNLK